VNILDKIVEEKKREVAKLPARLIAVAIKLFVKSVSASHI